MDNTTNTTKTTPHYYPIDENTARRAHEMMSFRDYKSGSATEEYRAAVDKAAALVERRKAATSPWYHDKLDALLDRYARRLAQWTNDYNRNGASCPSVMVCGPANFPTRKKERQNAREDSLWLEYKGIEDILDNIKSIGTGPVDFADPNARELLESQIQRLQKQLDDGKAMNAWYRKHKTMKGYPGMSDERAEKYDKIIRDDYSWRQKPMQDYELKSLREKIKRVQARLEELEKRQTEDAPEGWTFEGGEVIINTELNRLQIVLEGRPDDDMKQALKGHGFRWAPSQGAWQRQYTDNAIRAAREITRKEA